MATLIVPIADVSTNALPGTSVLARLSDIYGRPITGITVSGGYVVEPQLEYSNEVGIATFELVPNDQMVQDNTFYSIKVAHYPPVIIHKTAAVQTLLDAIATEPAELGPAATLDSLGDVEVDGADTGDVLRKAASGFWEPYALPGGSVPAYSHEQGVAANVWTVNHALGRYPIIDVLDSTGRVLIGEIQHNSPNQATVTLLTALTGKAECR